MPITATCGDCHSQYRLADTAAGRRVKCRNCGGAFTVPEAEPAPADIPDVGLEALAAAAAAESPAEEVWTPSRNPARGAARAPRRASPPSWASAPPGGHEPAAPPRLPRRASKPFELPGADVIDGTVPLVVVLSYVGFGAYRVWELLQRVPENRPSWPLYVLFFAVQAVVFGVLTPLTLFGTLMAAGFRKVDLPESGYFRIAAVVTAPLVVVFLIYFGDLRPGLPGPLMFLGGVLLMFGLMWLLYRLNWVDQLVTFGAAMVMFVVAAVISGLILNAVGRAVIRQVQPPAPASPWASRPGPAPVDYFRPPPPLRMPAVPTRVPPPPAIPSARGPSHNPPARAYAPPARPDSPPARSYTPPAPTPAPPAAVSPAPTPAPAPQPDPGARPDALPGAPPGLFDPEPAGPRFVTEQPAGQPPRGEWLGRALAPAKGRRVDLMPGIDPRRDAVVGGWRKVNGELVVDGTIQSHLAVRRRLPAEYDFVVEVTRNPGSDLVGQIVTGGGTRFGWYMGQEGNKYFAFDMVGGKILHQNPTAMAPPGGCLEAGRRHVSVVQVRRDGVSAYLDDKMVGHWKTDYSDLRLHGWFSRMPKEAGLGLISYAGGATFHKVELIEVAGSGRANAGR